MQEPIFDYYNVEPRKFWNEVDNLSRHYESQHVRINEDSAYLGHMLTYVKEGIFDGLGEAILDFQMNSDLEDITVYYPKLSSEEPDIKFIEFSDIPKSQTLTAHADLYIENSTMLTVDGSAYLDLAMSSALGPIEVFYPKADPEDPDDHRGSNQDGNDAQQ